MFRNEWNRRVMSDDNLIKHRDRPTRRTSFMNSITIPVSHNYSFEICKFAESHFSFSTYITAVGAGHSADGVHHVNSVPDQ